MIGFSDLLHLFAFSSKEAFPYKECTEIIDEENVYESRKEYMCLIMDDRFPTEFSIRVCRPYIFKDPDTKEESYAWTNVACNGGYIDNIAEPVHGRCDNEYVVGFAEYNKDDRFWSRMKEIIEKDEERE